MSAIAAAAIAAVPMATGFAFESDAEVLDEVDGELLAAGGVDTELPVQDGDVAEPVILLDDAAELVAEDETEAETAPVQVAAINDTVDSDLICLVKIVRHEAANQSMTGQLAVAQLVMNRVNSPRFPNTICDVAHQRGQFFNTNAYNPSRDDQRWANAMEVAIDARNGISDPVIDDAVFYHAAYVSPRFHRSRPRVAQIEDHIFYR
ncbi:MAG: cell wall hydrolase [Pseudomonadota bacterium]